jgi:hypothetical protein
LTEDALSEAFEVPVLLKLVVLLHTDNQAQAVPHVFA